MLMLYPADKETKDQKTVAELNRLQYLVSEVISKIRAEFPRDYVEIDVLKDSKFVIKINDSRRSWIDELN